ncbi:MAG TPA: globin [Chloroflexota bacterium]|nr:globin [Chloroflexota bacterium]
MTIYEAVGGYETLRALVDAFYDGVERDAVLRPLYPEDLGPPRRHLMLFLIQYFGGPQTYQAERGHPRLRARHLAFPIDQAARDVWVRQMTSALQSTSLPIAAQEEFLRYFDGAATFLMNR